MRKLAVAAALVVAWSAPANSAENTVFVLTNTVLEYATVTYTAANNTFLIGEIHFLGKVHDGQKVSKRRRLFAYTCRQAFATLHSEGMLGMDSKSLRDNDYSPAVKVSLESDALLKQATRHICGDRKMKSAEDPPPKNPAHDKVVSCDTGAGNASIQFVLNEPASLVNQYPARFTTANVEFVGYESGSPTMQVIISRYTGDMVVTDYASGGVLKGKCAAADKPKF